MSRAAGAARAAAPRLLVFGLWVVAIAVAGEIGLRVWDRFHVPTASLYQLVVPAGGRFKLRPDTAVVVPERYGDVGYRFNHEGYRDVDHDPAGQRRKIVWLGDSVSFGLGAPQDGTFVARLQRALDARYGAAFEIVNLAIFAYDTRHERETLAEDGCKYRPGLVVVQFYMNDLALAPPPAQAVAAASWGDRLGAVKNRLLYGSALYRRAHQALAGAAYALFHDARRRHFPHTLNADEPKADLRYLAARPDDRSVPTFAELARIAELARHNGARLLVLISPDEVQLFDRRYDAINARVAGFCQRQGIQVFDPLPALRASGRREELFYDGVHYSPEGHGVMARLLFAELVNRALLPR